LALVEQRLQIQLAIAGQTVYLIQLPHLVAAVAALLAMLAFLAVVVVVLGM
jgi:hypothetical protein